MPKYEGKIDIIDGDGKPVATLLWLGDTVSGTGRWTNLVSKEWSGIISEVIARNVDLAKIQYSEMFRDGATVAGWEGFSGYYQALRDILPGVGLRIKSHSVEWPIPPGKDRDEKSVS